MLKICVYAQLSENNYFCSVPEEIGSKNITHLCVFSFS